MDIFPKHPLFLAPPPETVLWRYMHLAKLWSLLARRALWFSHLDHLADAYEGRYGEATLARFPYLTDRVHRQSLAVNCWCESPGDSALHWSAFCPGGFGIAITSTTARLARSIQSVPFSRHLGTTMFIGRVRYMDFDRQLHVPRKGYPTYVFGPVITKRRQFAAEKEIRLVLWSDEAGRTDAFAKDGGANVRVRLPEMLASVVCGPSTPSWLMDDIRRTLTRYRLGDVPVRRSAVDGRPDGK